MLNRAESTPILVLFHKTADSSRKYVKAVITAYEGYLNQSIITDYCVHKTGIIHFCEIINHSCMKLPDSLKQLSLALVFDSGPGVVQRYLNKVSGPLLDRIDLHVEVTPVTFDQMTETRKSETSHDIQLRVEKARAVQATRFAKFPDIFSNAMMPPQMVKDICEIDAAGRTLLKTAMERLGLSARAYDRILKVARTIADLAGSEEIRIEHLAEAIQYRSLDREGWAG